MDRQHSPPSSGCKHQTPLNRHGYRSLSSTKWSTVINLTAAHSLSDTFMSVRRKSLLPNLLIVCGKLTGVKVKHKFCHYLSAVFQLGVKSINVFVIDLKRSSFLLATLWEIFRNNFFFCILAFDELEEVIIPCCIRKTQRRKKVYAQHPACLENINILLLKQINRFLVLKSAIPNQISQSFKKLPNPLVLKKHIQSFQLLRQIWRGT